MFVRIYGDRPHAYWPSFFWGGEEEGGCYSDDATAALIQTRSQLAPAIYFVSSNFNPSLSPLLDGNYTKKQNPLAGAPLWEPKSRNAVGVYKHGTLFVVHSLRFREPIKSSPACYGYDRASTLSDDATCKKLKPLLQWIIDHHEPRKGLWMTPWFWGEHWHSTTTGPFLVKVISGLDCACWFET
jgi:hypothetical protein